MYGLDTFILQSDHKPLIPMINCKDLNSVPIRCQRLLLRMMHYNPTAEYVPGKELVIVDTLSRHPQAAETQEVAELASEIQGYEEAIQSAWPISPTKLDLIKQQTLLDVELQMVQHYMRTGWPKYAVKVPDKVKATLPDITSLHPMD